MSTETRIVNCKSCGRAVEVPHPEAGGRPYGWYSVSVGVPPGYNARTGKPYRWAGRYCCADCLANGIAGLQADEQKEGHAYRRD